MPMSEGVQIIRTGDFLSARLPLTLPTGKVRVKRRSHFAEYGIPVAARSAHLSQQDYVEWQIGYDLLANEENAEKTSLREYTFLNSKGEKKFPYELAEILFESVGLKLISEDDISQTFQRIKAISERELLDVSPEMNIRRTNPIEKTLNGVDFYAMEVCCPLIVHRFGVYDVYVEIISREKQRAVGIQPMLYVCIPLTVLNYKEPHFGRSAEKKECADWDIGVDEAKMALEMMHLFGMLSARHRHDVLSILKTLFPQTAINH